MLQAEKLSRAWGTTAEQVLFATGQMSEQEYYQALAVHAGLNFTDLDQHPPDWSFFKRVAQRALGQGDIVPLGAGTGGLQVAYAPRGQAARRMARMADEPALGGRLRQNIFIATPGAIRKALLGRFHGVFTQSSIDRLSRQTPELSARYHLLPLQKIFLLVFLISSVAFLLWQPFTAYTAGNLILAAVFLAVTGFRLAAAFRSILLGLEPHEKPVPDIPDRDLPVYTILVPLYREANMLTALVRALKALDYPPAKLDIKLILEESDDETRKKARELDLPYAFDVIVVPNSMPRTKPKALNYALQFARGDYVVIYDAEDRPDPDQLRKAVAAFNEGSSNLACIQARLGIYNPNQNWLTSQFTIEYAALFRIMLPALEAIGAPLPLGGTSNHFRRDRLEEVGAWDPFNVTEDADLGMRLSRLGYQSRMLDSVTAEESCSDLGNWFRQRTRWFKGWLQTYAVHMREPHRAWRELGLRGFLTLQLMMGGILISALAHPLFLALILYGSITGAIFRDPGSAFGEALLALNIWNLVAGYIGGVALGLCGLKAAGIRGLGPMVVFIPVYWLLVSFAAYRAVWQFFVNPFFWEKTRHGRARGRDLSVTERKRKISTAPNIP